MHIPAHVELTLMTGSTPDERFWLARINDGPEFRLSDYALQASDDGDPVLNLVLPVASLSVEDSRRAKPQTPAVPEVSLKTWGDPVLSDPREKIPDWQAEALALQVATNAQQVTA